VRAVALATRDVRTLIDCVGRLYSPPVGPFSTHVLAAVRDLIPADTRGWHRIDVGNGGMAYCDYADDPPGAFGLPTLIAEAAAATFPEHPVVAPGAGTKGRAGAIAISDLIGARAFHRLAIYHEFFRPFGIEDQLAVAVPESYPRLAGISFHRSTRSFGATDRLLLDLIRPHLKNAERNAAALERARAHSAGLEAALAARAAGILVLDVAAREASPAAR